MFSVCSSTTRTRTNNIGVEIPLSASFLIFFRSNAGGGLSEDVHALHRIHKLVRSTTKSRSEKHVVRRCAVCSLIRYYKSDDGNPGSELISFLWEEGGIVTIKKIVV